MRPEVRTAAAATPEQRKIFGSTKLFLCARGAGGKNLRNRREARGVTFAPRLAFASARGSR